MIILALHLIKCWAPGSSAVSQRTALLSKGGALPRDSALSNQGRPRQPNENRLYERMQSSSRHIPVALKKISNLRTAIPAA